jgi:hypothetical protein
MTKLLSKSKYLIYFTEFCWHVRILYTDERSNRFSRKYFYLFTLHIKHNIRFSCSKSGYCLCSRLYELVSFASSIYRSYRHAAIMKVLHRSAGPSALWLCTLCFIVLCRQLSLLIIKYLNSSAFFFHTHDTRLFHIYHQQLHTHSFLLGKTAERDIQLQIYALGGGMYFLSPFVIISLSKTLTNPNSFWRFSSFRAVVKTLSLGYTTNGLIMQVRGKIAAF